MDKSREQFESFFKRDYHPDKTGPYIKDVAFLFWQASREAIEVEFPDKVFVEDEFDNGHNCAIDYCAESITSLGLKVKA